MVERRECIARAWLKRGRREGEADQGDRWGGALRVDILHDPRHLLWAEITHKEISGTRCV